MARAQCEAQCTLPTPCDARATQPAQRHGLQPPKFHYHHILSRKKLRAAPTPWLRRAARDLGREAGDRVSPVPARP